MKLRNEERGLLVLCSALFCILAATTAVQGQVRMFVVGPSNAMPDETITAEVWVEASPKVVVRGAQANMPCSAGAKGGSSGSIDFVADGAYFDLPDRAADFIYSACYMDAACAQNMNNALDQGSCPTDEPRAAASPLSSADAVSVTTPVYIASFDYHVSLGAAGVFNITPLPPFAQSLLLDPAGDDIPFQTWGLTIRVGPCTTDADCHDNDLCTTDTCIAGHCEWVRRDCDDGNLCTADVCTSVACYHAPVCGACCDSSGGCSEVLSAASCTDGTYLDGVSCTPDPCAAGGTCSPDADGDGIQTSVDPNDTFASNAFVDTSTSPSTTGSYVDRGDQDLCASDEPSPQGVRVESLSGGSTPATVELRCFGSPTDVETRNLASGDCVIMTCVSGPRARVGWCAGTAAGAGSAAAGPIREVELALLRSGVVVATVVLPEGNSITYDPQTAEATAPASNDTTLTLVGRSGQGVPLPPGETTTVPDSAIPAASTWGLIALALTLLVGGKVYFNRRRTTHA